MSSSTSKRKRSNEQRLKAVEEKRAQLKARSLSINVSKNIGSGKHVVFSSDSAESSEDDSTEHAQKLTLFGSESEDGESIDLETKFEGDQGRELFQLQQRIGHDRRFRVDARFLDGSEKEEEGRVVKDDGQCEDELSLEIQKEKDNALRIIKSMFRGGALQRPSDAVRSLNEQVSQASSLVLPVRYEPDTETASQLELVSATDNHDAEDTSSSKDEEELLPGDKAAPLSPQPAAPVSTERYYSIKDDIKDLFSSSQEQFSFLADIDRESSGESVSDELASDVEPTASSHSGPNWLQAMAKQASLKAEEEGEIIVNCKVDQSEEENTTIRGERTRLFFHSCSPNLHNRLEENLFYRAQPLSQLEEKWPLRRNVMKQSFRKRRKDAIKLSRKRRKHQ